MSDCKTFKDLKDKYQISDDDYDSVSTEKIKQSTEMMMFTWSIAILITLGVTYGVFYLC